MSKPGYISAGQILFEGQELNRLPEEDMRKIRGNRISMIFQDPMMTLNPVLTINTQMVETVLAHENVSKAEAVDIALDKLKKVHIPSPEKRLHQYPPRVLRRNAAANCGGHRPADQSALIIADEPTTALDVTIQAEIMDLLQSCANPKKWD